MKQQVRFCDEVTKPQYWPLDEAKELPHLSLGAVLHDADDSYTTYVDIKNTFAALQESQASEDLGLRVIPDGESAPVVDYSPEDKSLVRITLDQLIEEDAPEEFDAEAFDEPFQNDLADKMVDTLLYRGLSPVCVRVNKDKEKLHTVTSTVLYGLASLSSEQIVCATAEGLAAKPEDAMEDPLLLPRAVKVGELYNGRTTKSSCSHRSRHICASWMPGSSAVRAGRRLPPQKHRQ